MSDCGRDWWRKKAGEARRLLRESPGDSAASLSYVVAAGRWLLLTGENGLFHVSPRNVVDACPALRANLKALRGRLFDLPWVMQALPEVARELALTILEERYDVFAFQYVLDDIADRLDRRTRKRLDDAMTRADDSFTRTEAALSRRVGLLWEAGARDRALFLRASLDDVVEPPWWLDDALVLEDEDQEEEEDEE